MYTCIYNKLGGEKDEIHLLFDLNADAVNIILCRNIVSVEEKRRITD